MMNNIPDMVKALADWLGIPASLSVLVYAAGILVACCIMLGIVLACSIVWTWAERRVSGRIQSRIGPNRGNQLDSPTRWEYQGRTNRRSTVIRIRLRRNKGPRVLTN